MTLLKNICYGRRNAYIRTLLLKFTMQSVSLFFLYFFFFRPKTKSLMAYWLKPCILVSKVMADHDWVEKTPTYFFSTFGSKINEFERKKMKKFQEPKSCRQLSQHLIHTVFQIFHMENQDNQPLLLQLLKIISGSN